MSSIDRIDQEEEGFENGEDEFENYLTKLVYLGLFCKKNREYINNLI